MNDLAQILERLPGMIFCFRIDPATRSAVWSYMNPAVRQLYDVSDDELQEVPRSLLDRVLDEDRARLEATAAQCIATGAPFAWTGRIQRRSGEIRWLETHAAITRESDGMILWTGQTLDVTDRKSLEQALAASEEARTKADELHRAVIEGLPVGIAVMDASGRFTIYNATQREMAGDLPGEDGRDLDAFGAFQVDGVTFFQSEEMPLVRALQGEEAPEAEMILRNPSLQTDRRLIVTARPLRDASGAITGALSVSQDATVQRKLEMDLQARNEQLGVSEAAKAALIEQLRALVDELSTPILEVDDDVLTMPIIGMIDSHRASEMVGRLLEEVTRTRASFVIVDLTGVELVDTATADHLLKLMRALELVGARCVFTGIRPGVARTLVSIGVDLAHLTTLRNLKQGLREALRVRRRTAVE